MKAPVATFGGRVSIGVGLGAILAIAGGRPASAQSPSREQNQGALDGGEPSVRQTTFFETALPLPPWLGNDALQTPDWAQEVAPASPFLRPGLGTTAIGGSPFPGPFSGSAPRSSPWRVGMFDFWPRLGYNLTYGTGLLAGPGREEATLLNTVTPALTVGFGDHWTVGYAPSVRLYSSDGYQNTVNHSMTLGWRTDWQNWAFRMHHGTAITSDPLVETASQTDQTIHATGVGATWNLAERGAFDFSLNQNLRLTSGYSDSYSWSSQNWYDRPIWPKLKAGVGWSVGYDSIEPGTDMSNQRLQARLDGKLGEKISFQVGGGGEWRFFYGAEAPTALSPLVNASLSYQILERTSFSLGFSRDVGVSFFSGQYSETTSIQGGVIQILTDRWSVFANAGYRVTRFQETTVADSNVREDGTTFITTGVHARIVNRISSSLSYSFRSNDSDQSQYGFDSHQVSFNLSWAL